MTGIIEKGIDFHNNLILYTEEGEHLATIKSTGKLNSPTLTAIGLEGNNLIKAKAGTVQQIFHCITVEQTNKFSLLENVRYFMKPLKKIFLIMMFITLKIVIIKRK